MVHPVERRPGCGLSSARSVRRPRFSDTAKAVSLERRSIRAASSGSEVVYSRPCEAPVPFHRSKGIGATLPAAAVAAWSYPARQSPDAAARRVPEGDEAGRRIGDLGRRGAARIDGLTAGDGGAGRRAPAPMEPASSLRASVRFRRVDPRVAIVALSCRPPRHALAAPPRLGRRERAGASFLGGQAERWRV